MTAFQKLSDIYTPNCNSLVALVVISFKELKIKMQKPNRN